jgi:hypothetical protein
MKYIPRRAPLNCLLMLSSRQPPHPEDEMKWHDKHCRETGETWIATTRLLSRELQKGESIIAFYGDSELNNQYLGKGIYIGYEEISRPSAERHRNSDLYSKYGLPSTTRGFIGLKNVEVADRLKEGGGAGVKEQSIKVLDGWMRESAKARRTRNDDDYKLLPENLPPSAARIQVYYYNDSDLKE